MFGGLEMNKTIVLFSIITLSLLLSGCIINKSTPTTATINSNITSAASSTWYAKSSKKTRKIDRGWCKNDICRE